LEPGADLSFGEERGVPVIHMPARLDQVFAALHGFVRPALARLSGAKAAEQRLPLAQKIASRVGVAEFALLEACEGQFHPRALGDLPLQSLASATHVSLIAALSEGHAAGDVISAIPVRA
jgi:molybdopterin biosynthesis enzyme